MTNSIILQNLTTESLGNLISERIKSELDHFKKDLNSKNADDELLTRDEACEFLKINSSTLWHWTKKGKVTAYGIGNRRYYKRSGLLESLTQKK